MRTADIISEAFGRVQGTVHRVVDGLSADQLAARPAGRGNTIAWLVWHLTRIQDDHIAGAMGSEQVWITGGWVERFGLPFDPTATGYGHTDEEVGAVRASSELLRGYHDAVHALTLDAVGGLADGDLDRIVDRSFDPPVTLGVRLVSVINDDLQHAGQAAFARGLITGA